LEKIFNGSILDVIPDMRYIDNENRNSYFQNVLFKKALEIVLKKVGLTEEDLKNDVDLDLLKSKINKYVIAKDIFSKLIVSNTHDEFSMFNGNEEILFYLYPFIFSGDSSNDDNEDLFFNEIENKVENDENENENNEIENNENENDENENNEIENDENENDENENDENENNEIENDENENDENENNEIENDENENENNEIKNNENENYEIENKFVRSDKRNTFLRKVYDFFNDEALGKKYREEINTLSFITDELISNNILYNTYIGSEVLKSILLICKNT